MENNANQGNIEGRISDVVSLISALLDLQKSRPVPPAQESAAQTKDSRPMTDLRAYAKSKKGNETVSAKTQDPGNAQTGNAGRLPDARNVLDSLSGIMCALGGEAAPTAPKPARAAEKQEAAEPAPSKPGALRVQTDLLNTLNHYIPDSGLAKAGKVISTINALVDENKNIGGGKDLNMLAKLIGSLLYSADTAV